MDKRVDEKILDFINEVEQRQAKKDICSSPIKIGNRYYEFEETYFFEEKLKMYIPKDFEDISEEARKLNYSPENGPDIIKCNEKEDIRITFKIIDNPLDEKSVEKLKNEMRESMKNSNPINVFYEDGMLEVNSKNIGYFDFKSYTIDEPICSFMFFLEFEGKALMGTFRCPYAGYGEWKEVVFQIIKTIRVIKEDKGDEN
ncbi:MULTISPECIES: hypothetical protein [unclassified Clostridium]|uniref:hypothetical protein n=1 Tax=unclassified Clostridium TaxID=2614128 RepID=UPI000297F98B|nr:MULTISPECIES: hypothetical protein [unclassified Clostridium]EKQ53190.1 MAG: hypothetical protein A370_03878 [Clostridium sp. Maddingley MBC34-26]